MQTLAAQFFERLPEFSFGLLGSNEYAGLFDTSPFGVRADFLDSEAHADLAMQCLRLCELEATGRIPNGAQLTAGYFLTGAVGVMLGPSSLLSLPDRERLVLGPDERAIFAACFLLPTITPGRFVLGPRPFLLPDNRIAAWTLALTLKAFSARRLCGIAQWSDTSLRELTRQGPVRVTGPISDVHELADQSFLFELDVTDERSWAAAMSGRGSAEPSLKVEALDGRALASVLARVGKGERLMLVTPGLDEEGRLNFREAPAPTAKGEGLVWLDDPRRASTPPPALSALSSAEEIELRRQADEIQKHLRRRLGKVSLRKVRADLVLLQQLVDPTRSPGVEQPPRGVELAVAFGDVLARELGFHWVGMTSPEAGRMLALRYKATSLVLPLEQLVRRLEGEGHVDLSGLFSEFELALKNHLDLRARGQ